VELSAASAEASDPLMGSTGEASDLKSANPEERTRLRAYNSGRDNDLLDEFGSFASILAPNYLPK
jgi:hypothetical protein